MEAEKINRLCNLLDIKKPIHKKMNIDFEYFLLCLVLAFILGICIVVIG